MNIYRVSGIRHDTVVFATSSGEAVAQADDSLKNVTEIIRILTGIETEGKI